MRVVGDVSAYIFMIENFGEDCKMIEKPVDKDMC